ncbi:CU044_5270 family protein [Microbispora corallina]|nr:CU044_5270 family protein [Microbispora corallina]
MNAEIEDLARMLPDPGGPELPPMRHRQMRDHFVREIGRRRRRRPRLLLAPAAAAVLALVLAFAVLRPHDVPAREVSSTTAPVIRVPDATAQGVAETLGRIADAAARRPVTVLPPGGFAYTRSVVSSSRPDRERTFGGPLEPIALHERQAWIPGDASGKGLIRENGGETTLSPARDTPTYDQLAALPADPEATLEWLYARQGDRSPARAFDQVQGLLDETVVPPAARAALYRATALIPGVRVVRRSQDALGRDGVGVAFDANGERTEWVFDRSSLVYLGSRDYLVRDSGRGEAGTVLSASAVLAQGVTDAAGRLP